MALLHSTNTKRHARPGRASVLVCTLLHRLLSSFLSGFVCVWWWWCGGECLCLSSVDEWSNQKLLCYFVYLVTCKFHRRSSHGHKSMCEIYDAPISMHTSPRYLWKSIIWKALCCILSTIFVYKHLINILNRIWDQKCHKNICKAILTSVRKHFSNRLKMQTF